MPPASDLRPAPTHRPSCSSDTQPVDPLLSDAFQRHPAGGVPLLRQRVIPPVSSFMRRLNPILAQDHVLVERKRREKLNRNFISLSSLIPKLKKMDKASVLEDASIYIKEHQDWVKELEGLSGTKRKNVQDCVLHACKVICVTYVDNFFSMIPML
uniref:BHLH domain-containing protein n=1 Tax=Lactuca sativa TaxID=4236 RepID=A0A9R1VP29_LACSA|nr:hypothetical protein LSAT_V11C400202980 [Lactuca sativa]